MMPARQSPARGRRGRQVRHDDERTGSCVGTEKYAFHQRLRIRRARSLFDGGGFGQVDGTSLASSRLFHDGPHCDARHSQVDGTRQGALHSTNELLLDPDVTGVKTGYTSKAGRCLIASMFKDGHQLLLVGLNVMDRWEQATQLLRYGQAVLRGGQSGARAGSRPTRWR